MPEFAVTEEYQAKVLAYMLNNREFCEVGSSYLSPEDFSNRALQWFFNVLSTTALTPITLQEEMVRAAKAKVIRQEEVSKFVHLYDIIKQKPVPAEEEYIRTQLTTFIRTQAVKRAVLEAASMTEEQQWDGIVDVMQSAVSAGVDLQDNGHDYFKNVEARIESRRHREKARRIPTGIPDLDELTYGGIKNKQTGLIVGGTGRGKSILLQWLCRTAVLLGKKVVYFTLELSEDDIADRFDAMFAKLQPNELNDYQERVIEEIAPMAKTFGSSLIIKHYPADTATVYTLKNFVRQLSNSGIVPDLVVVDYLDLLKPHRTYHSTHEEMDAIVKALIGFGSEYDISMWTAAQLNRSGLTMETPDESSIAGAVSKQFHVDMVLFMAQTKEERLDEVIRLSISKNRNGPAGRVIKLDTDYSYMTFYREQQKDYIAEEIQENEKPQSDLSGNLQLLLENNLSDGQVLID